MSQLGESGVGMFGGQNVADGRNSRGRPGAAKAVGAVKEAEGLGVEQRGGRVGREGWTCRALQRVFRLLPRANESHQRT